MAYHRGAADSKRATDDGTGRFCDTLPRKATDAKPFLEMKVKTIASSIAAAALAGTMLAVSPAPASANPLIAAGITLGVLGFFAHHAAMADGASDGPWLLGHHGRVVVDADVAHRDRCSEHYRSYDRDTDMFMGKDGEWRLCRL